MDHYCPWMGNTVGAKNHRDFVIFLLLETFAMIVSLLVAVVRVWDENPSEKQRSKTLASPHLIGFVLVL